MARCSAAKQTGNPNTNFMAPGMIGADQDGSDMQTGRVGYGPDAVAGMS